MQIAQLESVAIKRLGSVQPSESFFAYLSTIDSINSEIVNLKLSMANESARIGSETQDESDILAQAENRIGSLFRPYFSKLIELEKGLTAKEAALGKEYFMEKVVPHFENCAFANRVLVKPRGYAGDYEMMNQIYRGKPGAPTLFERCLDFYTLQLPFAHAVRNRVEYLNQKIKKFVSQPINSENINILSIACGPAREICEFIRTYPGDLSKVTFHLLDQDEEAIEFAVRSINDTAETFRKKVKVVSTTENVVSFARRKEIKGFDLIYTAGLFDYFTDSLAKLIASRLFNKLHFGGELVIGNFKPDPVTQSQIELLGEWYLTYRDKSQLEKMFSDIADNVQIESEKIGINLFATLSKSRANVSAPADSKFLN